ncbi:TPA: hypothetical protein ROY17_002029 [Bacillus thuringiensis]|nr:hypothetical protein [Bacillus thuringiensis]
MDLLIEKAITMLLTKETAFFGLFLISFILQWKDKGMLHSFILKQQGVLADLTSAVQDIAKTQDKQHERIERMEDNLDRFYDKVNTRLNDNNRSSNK